MVGMRPLDNSSSSEEEDKADLLGRNFQVPRPKSRSNASVAVSISNDRHGTCFLLKVPHSNPYGPPKFYSKIPFLFSLT